MVVKQDKKVKKRLGIKGHTVVVIIIFICLNVKQVFYRPFKIINEQTCVCYRLCFLIWLKCKLGVIVLLVRNAEKW